VLFIKNTTQNTVTGLIDLGSLLRDNDLYCTLSLNGHEKHLADVAAEGAAEGAADVAYTVSKSSDTPFHYLFQDSSLPL